MKIVVPCCSYVSLELMLAVNIKKVMDLKSTNTNSKTIFLVQAR